MTTTLRRCGRLYLFIAFLSACSGESPSPPGESQAPRTASALGAGPADHPPAPARPEVNSITWTTTLGPGGADVPAWPVLRSPRDASLGFSRLLGVVLPPGRNELLFVGVDDDPQRNLSIAELTDGFIVALRALPGAPGVSIDPTPAQLQRGLHEDDAMVVRYIGGDERAAIGAIAFEADRVMKSLSFGKDNLTKQAFTSKVPGYRSELEASLADPSGADREWHRFWIEQAENAIDISDDGRTLLVDAKLQVRTEYMQPRGGELVSGNRPPSGPAREFSEHLTAHYDEYAREIAVYHKLHAQAQMAALAKALTDTTSGKALDEAGRALDLDGLIGRATVAAVDTPETTPAIVATAKSQRGNQILQVFLTGGVDLTPKPRYQPASNAANQIQRLVLSSAERNSTRAAWVISQADGGPLIVARGRLSPSAARIWQTDMTVGPVRFGRVSVSTNGTIGRQWRPMLPELQFASEVIDLENGRRSPRFAVVSTITGERVILSQSARLQMPGQPATSGFLSALGNRRKRRALSWFSNGILFEEGEVRYVSANGASFRRELDAGVTVVEFSPEAPYRAVRIHSSDGTVNVLWEGNRLIGYQAESGERITLRYDPMGRIVGLEGSDGQLVDYRVDARGNLRAVVTKQGQSVSYLVSKVDGSVIGMWSEVSDMPVGGSVVYGPFEISPSSPLEAVREATSRLSDGQSVFIALMNAPAGEGRDVDVLIAGQEVRMPGSLERALEAVLDRERGKGPQSDWLRKTFLGGERALGRPNVVVVGEPSMRNLLARALGLVASDRVISTAANPQLAARNLKAMQGARGGFQHRHVPEGLDASINAAIEPLVNTVSKIGDLLIVSGHNSTELQATVQSLDVNGKTILLLTCGVPGTGALDGLLREAGATQVVAFDGPINARALAPLIRNIHARLEKIDQPASVAIRKVLSDSISDLLRSNPDGLTQDDVRVLENQIRQIGRRDDGPVGSEHL